MSLHIRRLRNWFALAAVAVVLVVAGFYFYAQFRVRRELTEVPKQLGIDIQQSTQGFSLSRSEGGRTLFTIRASRAIQYKSGGRAELQDVSIVVYGRRSERFDQIYGEKFEYDPQSGDVVAAREVHIDIGAVEDEAPRPDQAPPRELKNTIHLSTSGLVFNHKSGLAATDQRLEFRMPQASGSARGASYDSKTNLLTLRSEVLINTTGAQAADITARQATISKDPRQGVLEQVKIERANDTITAARLTVHLREDNSVERVLASGDVVANSRSGSGLKVTAPEAAFQVSESNVLRTGELSGGVSLETGEQQMRGSAERVLLTFAANQLQKARAEGNVLVSQRGSPERRNAQNVDLTADALDVALQNGKIERAVTSGRADVVVSAAADGEGEGGAESLPQGSRTVVTAGRFEADFDKNRLNVLRGTPDAKIVYSSPGQPDRVSTSRTARATFAPDGEVAELVQEEDFKLSEGPRSATAERASYKADTEVLSLTGSPRISEPGAAVSADSVRISRRTSDAVAEGNVKTTYSNLQAQPSGGMLGASEPIHVTSRILTFRRAVNKARFSGGARLWQGGSIVQAPTIEFDGDDRKLVAQGNRDSPVSTVFVQTNEKGVSTPVTVHATKLTYSDAQRRARFDGGVSVRGADAIIVADHVDVFLAARGTPVEKTAAPSQLDRIVAGGDISIEQATRKAKGKRLVYTAADGKFVLSGGPPSIFDAEHGTITGDSLTFYSRDDTVAVDSQGSSRTVTRTRVPE